MSELPYTPASADLIGRRAALARAASLLGGVLAAPTIAGVLAGCGGDAKPPARGAAARAAYRLQALTATQAAQVAVVAEHILPETDTPGARTARVHEFVDRMLAEYHTADDRARFTAGLARLDARSRRRHGRAFVDCTHAQQYALVDALDAQAFPDAPNSDASAAGAPASENAAGATRAGVAAQRDPATREPGQVAGQSYTSAAGATSGADERPDPADAGPQAFFRTMKELTLVGFYTSEAGATRELRVNPVGRYRPDVPYAELGRAWA